MQAIRFADKYANNLWQVSCFLYKLMFTKRDILKCPKKTLSVKGSNTI
jgi:hypothetical protein